MEDPTNCPIDCAACVQDGQPQNLYAANKCCSTGGAGTIDTVTGQTMCCPAGYSSTNGVCWSCPDGTCNDGVTGFPDLGENVTTCPLDCQLGPVVCPPPSVWQGPAPGTCVLPPSVCDASMEGQNCQQPTSTLIPDATHYCSTGIANQMSPPGYCCAQGYYWDPAAATCRSTSECNLPATCLEANTYPASLASYVADSTFCVGLNANTENSALGIPGACCNVGIKFGRPNAYYFSDASGNTQNNFQVY